MNKWEIGDWTKVTGGDFGVVKTSKGWQPFACIHCAREYLLNRRQLADLPPAGRLAIQKKATIPCRGREVHNQWYRDWGFGK